MLEPISPSHIPDKLPEVKKDSELKPAEEAGDSGGYSFNFFTRSKKKKQSQNAGESDSTSVYNDEKSVNLELSPEAINKLERQRELKKRRKSQEEE